MNKKVISYVAAGLLLAYYGLSDEDFILWYNGVALLMAISAFILAYFEYKKNR